MIVTMGAMRSPALNTSSIATMVVAARTTAMFANPVVMTMYVVLMNSAVMITVTAIMSATVIRTIVPVV